MSKTASVTMINVSIENHIGVISFNRPEVHNAMDDGAQYDLLNAVRELSDDALVRCIVLRGEGQSFCAGRDTRVLGQRDKDDSNFSFVQRAQRIQHAILDCPKPIVAALKGAAIGGGFEIALAADMRVVGHSASMCLPEILYGILPDMGGTQTLTSIVGRARAKYLVMTGGKLTGEQALDWGIAQWLVDDIDVDNKAMQIAAEIAAQSPQAIMMAKHLVDRAEVGEIKQGLKQELASITALFKTDDYVEARAALSEKRKPVFSGK